MIYQFNWGHIFLPQSPLWGGLLACGVCGLLPALGGLQRPHWGPSLDCRYTRPRHVHAQAMGHWAQHGPQGPDSGHGCGRDSTCYFSGHLLFLASSWVVPSLSTGTTKAHPGAHPLPSAQGISPSSRCSPSQQTELHCSLEIKQNI